MESLNRGEGKRERKLGKEEDEDDDDDDDSEEEDEKEQGSELSTFPENKEECKLVLVVRTDLGMGKGISFFRPSTLFLSALY